MSKLLFSSVVLLSFVTVGYGNNFFQENTNRITDSLELIRFYDLTGGENWIQKWNPEEPMNQWFGVALNENGRVKCLDLDGDANCNPTKNGGNNLTGEMPDLQLQFLEHIFLAGNKLTGEIPDFSGIPYLLTAQLCCNKFSGSIPDFSNLKNLISLELDYNQLTGAVPDFSKITRLENLYISNNQLTERLPEFKFLKNLKRLYVQQNQISGPIPSFRNNEFLEHVIGFQNNLEGTLPSLKNLKNLKRINLAGNNLNGKIPAFTAHPNLYSIILNNNRFEGNFPNWEHMTDLTAVDVSNNRLQGTIPDFSKNLTLKTLILENNQFENCRNLSGFQNLTNYSLKGNCLTFEDLLPSKTLLNAPQFYENQQPPGKDTIIRFREEGMLTLAFPFDKNTASNECRWFKNDAPFGENATLVLNPSSGDISGIYYCKITNPNLPGLELKTANYIVKTDEQVISESMPFATDDQFRFVNIPGEKLEFNPVRNDELEGVAHWDLKFLNPPKIGFISSGKRTGNYELSLPAGYAGKLQIEYEICNVAAAELCSVGLIEIEVLINQEIPQADVTVTEAISPYAGKLPSVFKIREVEENLPEFSMVSLTIFNQLGQSVYHNDDYQNDWDGKEAATGRLLKPGVYFYYLEFDGSELVKSGSVALIY